MSESAVVLGLGLVAYLFGYYAFNLRDSTVRSNQVFAVFLAIISMAFTHTLFYVVYLIVQNNLPYLDGPVLQTGLLVLTWVSAALVVYLVMALLWELVTWLATLGKRGRASE